MTWLNWIGNSFRNLFSWKDSILRSGFLPFRFLSSAPVFNDYGRDSEKLLAAFKNPAFLKVLTLQCDLFSLAKVYVYSKTEKVRKEDPALDRLENPNPLQTRSQFLWDFMFWKMLGNAHLYMSSDIVDRSNAPMYWLMPEKIDWPPELEREKDKLIFSESKLNDLLKTLITYRYDDGTTFKFPLSKMSTITDLTNGVGNWFKGHSRIDALYKIISNSEASLDSKNINVRFAGKFLVAGQSDPNDVNKLPMGEDEKRDIEHKIDGTSWQDKADGEKQVHAVKTMVDIKRFVEDLRVLELDKAYLADYYLIGAMYNIPRDVLEAYVSATFENQEKARAGHVSYTLEPVGMELGNMLGRRWGYQGKKDIILSWDHLPFTQVFEKERAEIQNKKALTLSNLIKVGLKLEEINIFLDTNFTEVKPADNGKEENKNGK